MRMIVRFGKRARLRFISHLDLQRFFQRALNRTGLPIAFSNGFNPHPVMAFGSALALGWTSEYEVIDVKLAEDVDALAAGGFAGIGSEDGGRQNAFHDAAGVRRPVSH